MTSPVRLNDAECYGLRGMLNDETQMFVIE